MSKNISRFALIDPAFMADGVFVPKANKSKAINIKRTWGEGEIGFRGVQLGAMHQGILLAICARTGRDGLKIEGKSDDLLANQLWLDLATKKDIKYEARSLVNTSAYALLTDAGMPTNGAGYKRLVDALLDLSTFVIFRQVGNKGGVSHLLSFDNDNEALTVSLNWRLTNAIFGGQNIQVSIHERLELESPVAKILHAWLSAFVRKNGSLMAGKGASINSMIPHIWGDNAVSKQINANRRAMIKESLKEINMLDNWVTNSYDNRVMISRPKIIGSDNLDQFTPGQYAEFVAKQKPWRQ